MGDLWPFTQWTWALFIDIRNLHEWPKELLSVPHNTFITLDFHHKNSHKVLRDDQDCEIEPSEKFHLL